MTRTSLLLPVSCLFFSSVLTSTAQAPQEDPSNATVPLSTSWSFIGGNGPLPVTTSGTQPAGPDSSTASKKKSNAYPATTHERFATFIADGDFKSQLLVQNLRLDLPVTIAPTLILEQGEVALDPVTLPAHSAATLDINAALESRGAEDKRGAVVIRYDFGTYGAVSAAVEMADYTHRLYLNSVAQSREEFWYGTTLDAVVWTPSRDDAEGFMSLINTSAESKSVKITLSVDGASEETREVIIGPRQQRLVSIDSLVKRSTDSGAGIHVAFTGKPGDIIGEGTVFNKKTGFSKYIRFMDSSLRFPNSSLRTNFLMLGPQPVEDGFPAQVSFRAVAVLRNIDTVSVQVMPVVTYFRNGLVRKISLEPLALSPNESKIIDFANEQRAGTLPSDFSQGTLELIPNSDHTSLVAELFNFNQRSGGYVVGSSFAAHPARATSSIWRIDGTFQTTIVAQNTASQNDQLTVKLFSGADTYEKTFNVFAGGLVKINLKELQEKAIPDNNGHLLLGTSGTLSLSGAHGVNSALAFDKLIHSADESEYVGLLANPCNFVTQIGGALSGSQSPFTVLLDDFWTDGTVTESSCCVTGVSDYNLLEIGSDSNGNITATTIASPDHQSHTVFMDFSQTTTTCDICSGDTLMTSLSVEVPALPACPSTVSVTGITTIPLENGFPQFKSGLGGFATMVVGPATVGGAQADYANDQITEAVSFVSNNCPANTLPNNICAGADTFTVGAGTEDFNVKMPPATNTFYDEHATGVIADILANTPIVQVSCQVVCSQTYSCGGVNIGNFTITRTFTKDVIQNTDVARLTITKQ